jgi:hypothetical protein
MYIRSKVILTIEEVAKKYECILAPLTDDLVLLDSGLDSLSFAVVVARLEDELKVYPFTASEVVDLPLTLRDFVAGYEDAINSIDTVPPR